MNTSTPTSAWRISSWHVPIFGMLLLLMTCLVPVQAQAGVTARVDRATINEGETFTLNLKATGDNDGQPDVSPLQKDFEVLGTGQRSEVQIINGSVEANRSWTITLSPRHAGNLIIPPLTLGNDTSAALAVTVLPASASTDSGTDHGDVFIEVNAKPDSVYVQAQLLYTVRLYYAVSLRQGKLSEPTLDNAIVQKLGDDSKFETQRNGRTYQVIERRYAIFPQRSGALEIPAVVFDGDVSDQSRRSLDPFFDNFNPSTHHVRLRSRKIDVRVDAHPASYSGANWLPAQDLSLEEKWSPENPKFRVGEPVTRTVIVRAKGLSASQLPDLPQPDQSGLKLYPDQPQTHSSASDDALISEREQKIAMIPTQAGDLTLPAIHLNWWDTEAGRQRSAELPSRTIHVLPALASDTGTAAMPLPVMSSAAPKTASGKSDAAAVPAAGSVVASNAQHNTRAVNLWTGLAAFFALAWIVTLSLWWHRSRSRRAASAVGHGTGDGDTQVAVKRVRQACQDNDRKALKNALLVWARLHWPKEPPLSLGALATRVGNDQLASQISHLDQFLYDAKASDWQSEQFLEIFTEYIKHSVKQNRQDQSADLKPLHLNKSRTSVA